MSSAGGPDVVQCAREAPNAVNFLLLAHEALLEGDSDPAISTYLDAWDEYEAKFGSTKGPFFAALQSSLSAAHYRYATQMPERDMKERERTFLDAVTAASECISAAPKWWKGHYRLGSAYLQLGRHVEAAECLLSAQSLISAGNGTQGKLKGLLKSAAAKIEPSELQTLKRRAEGLKGQGMEVEGDIDSGVDFVRALLKRKCKNEKKKEKRKKNKEALGSQQAQTADSECNEPKVGAEGTAQLDVVAGHAQREQSLLRTSDSEVLAKKCHTSGGAAAVAEARGQASLGGAEKVTRVPVLAAATAGASGGSNLDDEDDDDMPALEKVHIEPEPDP